MRKKLGLVLLGVFVVATGGLALGAGGFKIFGNPATTGDKLKVTASFYPMGEFVRQVGGDKVDVAVLVRPGVEPHDYDPTPREMAGVHQSKLLVYNGAGVEPWADKLKDELERAGIVVVRTTDGFNLLPKDPGDVEADDVSGHDPHVWLDPVLASSQVDRIRDGLVKADPRNKAVYESNAAKYKQKLAELDATFRTGLSQCARRDVVTAHQAFRYMGERYQLTMVGISGLSPDEEPSPQKLAEVAQYVREHGVTYIFFETLASPKLGQTIATETGAKTLVLNPLEGLSEEQTRQGESYVTVQRDNLENLRIALDCK